MFENEIWKNVKSYENIYQISSCGRIKSLKRITSNNHVINEKILKPVHDSYGYLKVNLYRNGNMKSFTVHKLVAMAFIITNNTKLTQINHIDEVKTNNNVENLEWCTSAYNNSYGTRNIKISKNKKIKIGQYTASNILIKIYDSIGDACSKNNFSRSEISRCCNNHLKYSHGYMWKYIV